MENCGVKQNLFDDFQRLTARAQSTIEYCKKEDSVVGSMEFVDNVHVQLIQAYGEYKKHIAEHGC